MSWTNFIFKAIVPEMSVIAKKMSGGDVSQWYQWVKKIYSSPEQWLCIDKMEREFHSYGDYSGMGFERSSHWQWQTILEACCMNAFGRPFHTGHAFARRFPSVPWNVIKYFINGIYPIKEMGLKGREVAPFLEWVNALCRMSKEQRTKWKEVYPMNYGIEYFRGRLGHTIPEVLRNARIRDRRVLEWAIRKKDWAGWNRPLPMGYGPDGRMWFENVQHMLDEVNWRHIDEMGINASPERVFREIAERRGEQMRETLLRLRCGYPKMPWKEIPGIHQVRTSDELVKWRDYFHNCSVGCHPNIIAEDSFILVITTSQGNSMAEMKKAGYCFQHLAIRNATPPDANVRLFKKWLREVGLE